MYLTYLFRLTHLISGFNCLTSNFFPPCISLNAEVNYWCSSLDKTPAAQCPQVPCHVFTQLQIPPAGHLTRHHQCPQCPAMCSLSSLLLVTLQLVLANGVSASSDPLHTWAYCRNNSNKTLPGKEISSLKIYA